MQQKTNLRVVLTFAVLIAFVFGLVPLQAGYAAPATVYIRVDGSDTQCNGTVNTPYPGSGGPGLNCALRNIQVGVNLVDPNGTVVVNAGTYTGQAVQVTKPVTLTGDPGDPSVAGPGANAPVLDFGNTQGNAFTIAAGVSGVTIRGFDVRNYANNPTNTVGFGVVFKAAGAAGSNIVVRDNRFTSIGTAAVKATTNGSTLLSGWDVSYNSIVLTADPSFSYASSLGVDLQNVQNASVSFNEISGEGYAGVRVMSFGQVGSPTVSNVAVTDNTIDLGGALGAGSVGVWLWAVNGGASSSLSGVSVERNSITTIYTGISSYVDAAADLQNVTIANNTIAVNDPAAGFFGAIDLIHLGGVSSILGNAITLTGAADPAFPYKGLSITGSKTGAVDVSDNMLTGNHVSSNIIGFNLGSTLPASAVLNYSANEVNGFEYSVKSSLLPVGAQVAFHFNRFIDNPMGFANDAAGEVIDAQQNWWNSFNGPVDNLGTIELPTSPRPALADMLNVEPPGFLGDPISENVEYYFWCTSPSCSGLNAFYGNGFTTATLEFAPKAAVFSVEIYLSGDAVQDGGDTLIDTVTVTDFSAGIQNFTIGNAAGNLNLPGTTPVVESANDYYILAYDPLSGASISFAGTYHLPGGPVFLHGSDGVDTVTISSAPVLDWNGLPFAYTLADVSAFRGRLHGDNDNASVSPNKPSVFFGGDGADALNGSTAATTFYGGMDDDTLSGGNQADSLYGEDGNDTLLGGSASVADSLFGGNGNDLLRGGLGNDVLNGNADLDTVSFASATAGVTCNLSTGVTVTCTGGDGSDSLTEIENLIGGSYVDTLTGATGVNVIEGGLGNDVVYGGQGDDLLYGNGGNDRLYGEAGNDFLDGGDNNDSLFGQANNDYMIGGNGNDTFNGDTGTDIASFETSTVGVTVNLGLASVQITGQGSDTLTAMENLKGSEFNDVLTGSSGNNLIFGLAGNDSLYGQGGDDSLDGGLGDDLVDGGTGLNATSYFDATDYVRVDLNIVGAQDTVNSGLDTLVNIQNIEGSDFDDELYGNANANLLNGGLGNNFMDGRGGTDTVDYRTSTVPVTVDLRGNLANAAGTDFLFNIENVTGSSFDDVLFGDGLNNVLNADGGNDWVSYEASPAAVNVTVTTGVVTGDGSDTLIGIENVRGSVFNDILRGDANANILQGLLGDDTLQGNGGNDSLEGNENNDSLSGGSGDDMLDGGTGSDTVTYFASITAVNANLNTGSATGEGTDALFNVEHLTGSNFNDTLTGNSGANVLNGGSGIDTLVGLAGADSLQGGTGNDFLYANGIGGACTADGAADILNGGGGTTDRGFSTPAEGDTGAGAGIEIWAVCP